MPTALTGLKLFGCTVKNFSTSLGWGSQKSSVRVTLVQDIALGDFFLPPPVGTPVLITFYALVFNGLLQKWEQKESAEGLPVFEVLIEDPREVLEACELIIGQYSGSIYLVPNLINVYGYCESLFGFGGAQVNDGGMPWNLIRDSVTNICTLNNGGIYGMPLQYKGITYTVDLSQIPVPPAYYRIGGNNVNLLQAIQQVCEDGGCDYFIDMVPGTTQIRVRTASRKLQPPTGVINSVVQQYTLSGECIRSSAGYEARNEITSSFLVGGDVTGMYEAVSAYLVPYFGLDVLGNPIMGVGTGYNMTANLNAVEVSDILGAFSYPCTALEMACALVSQNSWMYYMRANRKTLATAIGIISPFVVTTLPFDMFQLTGGPIGFPIDMFNLLPIDVKAAAISNMQDTNNFISLRMYNFVKKAADEYLGKRYLLQVPFVLSKVEPDTNKIVYSQEPTDAGYTLNGVPPLQLSNTLTNQFQNSDGRFVGYARYIGIGAADLSRVKTGDFVFDINGIYVKVDVEAADTEHKIIFLDPLTPCVVVRISNPLYAPPLNALGATTAVARAAFQMKDDAEVEAVMNRVVNGAPYLGVSTLPLTPDEITIPMKSNILSYGPWYGVGAQGKVSYRSDSSLTPWNYAGETIMNLTALAMVQETITFQLFAESGEIELVGPPLWNIGDLLQGNGPNVTNMDIQYGAGGVTTTYRFQTFTNRFGVFNKGNVERFKRISSTIQSLRSETKRAIQRLLLPQSSTRDTVAFLGAQFLKNLPRQVQRESPHTVLVAFSSGSGDYDAAFTSGNPALDYKRCVVSTVSMLELPRSLMAHDDPLHSGVAAMSLEGLIRPIHTSNRTYLTSSASGLYNYDTMVLPHYVAPNTHYSNALTVDDLNPFAEDNDISIYLWEGTGVSGTGYQDCRTFRQGGPVGSGQRVFALRSPLILCGWGWSVDDAFVPNATGNMTGGPLDGYLHRWHRWKTGPVDLLWDEERGIWTSHGFLMGKSKTAIGGNGGSALIDLFEDASTVITNRKKDRTVYNFWSRTIPAQTKIMAAWIPEANSWWVVAADCP